MKLKELVRKRIPNIFLLRSFLAKLKIRKYYKYTIPEEEIRSAEENPDIKMQVTEKYAVRWQGYAAKANEKIEEILQKAPVYKDRVDKAALRMDMLFCRLAYGFQPDEYLGFHLEGKRMDERRKYISDIDRYRYVVRMNDAVDFVVFMDKAQTYSRFQKYYKREAISIESRRDYMKFLDFVERHHIFVQKNVELSKGDSVELIDLATCAKSVEELFYEMIAQGKFIIEELVVQSAQMARMSKNSVNTVRCITFFTKNGIEIGPCFMKVGQGDSFVDNAGAGGIVIGIDRVTGELVTDGFDEFGRCFKNHPDTQVCFKGEMLPDWEELIILVKEMSAEEPNVKYIGWDLAHTDEGWIVIEGNGSGQFIIPQIVWQRGFKAEVEEFAGKMKLLL